MITRALLEVSIEGIGKLGLTPVFPCGIFQYMKGVNDNPNTPNYDLFRLALESTSKRLYPNYMLCNWSVDMAGNELDKKHKQEYIDSLTQDQMNKLVEWCEQNPEISTMLGLKVTEY